MGRQVGRSAGLWTKVGCPQDGRIPGRFAVAGLSLEHMPPPRESTSLLAASRRAAAQDGMLTWPQIRALGITQRQLRSLCRDHGWMNPCRGAYLLPGAHPVRGPARAALSVRPDGVICGPTAGRLWGLDALPAGATRPTALPVAETAMGAGSVRLRLREPAGRGAFPRQSAPLMEPAHLLLPRNSGVQRRPGIIFHFGGCVPAERCVRRGIAVTTVERTVLDLLLTADRESAVSLLDAALYRRRLADLDGLRTMATGRRGIARRRGWFDLVDGRAESPLESRLRLLLADADLPPPEIQWPVWEADGTGPCSVAGTCGQPASGPFAAGLPASGPAARPRGRLLARLDLAWPEARVAVEADGAAVHSRPDALFRDRIRQNDLLAQGWGVLRFTWADVLTRSAYVVAMVRRLLAEAQG